MKKKTELYVLLARQRQLNARMTHSEQIFQIRLRQAKVKHRSQQIIGPYIVDFVLPLRMIILEIDGSVHLDPAQIVWDTRRTAYLESLGFQVVRIPNEAVTTYSMEWLKRSPTVISKKAYRNLVGRLQAARNFPSKIVTVGNW